MAVTFAVFAVISIAGFVILTMDKNIHLVSLWIYLAIVAVVLAVMIGWIFYYLNRRNEDIELSKNLYFYAKPYIVQIGNTGRLISCNHSFQAKVKDCGKYKTIHDFEVYTESIDILHGIYKQESFTVKADSNEGSPVYIRFIPLKAKTGYYLIGIDITSDRDALDYHRSMALYNSTTNLPNRNYLGIKMQELFDDPQLLKRKNSLAAINISGFKNINRMFGYKIGDETLIQLGNILKESVREFHAAVFNTESDNFMILFSDLTSYQDVTDWCNRFQNTLSKPIDIQGNLFNIEVKVGIFHLETNKYQELNPVIVYENVMMALNKAKGSRRFNAVTYDIALGKDFTHEQALETALISAIRNDELEIFLQPQVNMATRKIVGFESLIRLKNPNYQLESPLQFIEIAEKNNLITDIGRKSLLESFRFAKEMEKFNTRVTINISPIQILQQGFVNEIMSVRDQFQVKTSLICFEITETFLMESYDQVIDKLTYLKEQGYRVALDNFGSGYSSMLYLKDLPIDGISINRDFIKGIAVDKNTRTIISKVISLGQSLNLEVIAEGVENEIQMKFLQENGCDTIQGFLISKPLPKEEVIAFHKAYTTRLKQ